MSEATPRLLLTPVQLGALSLRNRVVMAPMTRTRAEPGHVPGALMRDYYAQRASAGLLMTDCSMVAADASAFINDPGIYDEAQVQGWKAVTDAVHARGGLIAIQIWHPGRATHPYINAGVQPISSSDHPIRDDAGIQTPRGTVPHVAPRSLDTAELPGIVDAFRQAAARARSAGFDAVQIHGAHGYLIDQFLRDGVNDRKDAYGGGVENRARLLFEIVDAAMTEIGADRVALRISPLVAYNDMSDSDPKGLVAYVAQQFGQRRGAFLELRHNQHSDPAEQDLAVIARARLGGVPLLLNGGFDQASGEAALRAGHCDAVVYGKPFIANPDLVERFRAQAPLNAVDFSTLYAPGAGGYVDYPALAV